MRWIPLALVLVLAGCGSPHPAPIVHRTPVTRPAPTPAPVAVQPGAGATAAHPVPSRGEAAQAATGVQTTPVTRGPVESRPLVGSDAAGTGSANLLKTEPKALKQPYSEAALAQMTAQAPAVQSPPPSAPVLASAAPDSTKIPAQPPAATPAGGQWIWPADGRIVQDFSQPGNMGISIAGQPGDPVLAVNDGRVIFSGAGPRSYGNLIIVKHDGDILSVYAHNRALLVKEGQNVRRGQRIAELGSSGTASPQLHFEIRRQGRPIDPRTVLPVQR